MMAGFLELDYVQREYKVVVRFFCLTIQICEHDELEELIVMNGYLSNIKFLVNKTRRDNNKNSNNQRRN